MYKRSQHGLFFKTSHTHILFSHKYCSIRPSLILDSPAQLSLSPLSFAIPPTLLPVIKDTVKQSKTGEQGSPAGKELELHVPKTYNPEKMSKTHKPAHQ